MIEETKSISLRLEQSVLNKIKIIAKIENIGYQVLIKNWLSDRLANYDKVGFFNLLKGNEFNRVEKQQIYDELKNSLSKDFLRDFSLIVGGIGSGKSTECNERIIKWVRRNQSTNDRMVYLCSKGDMGTPHRLMENVFFKENMNVLSYGDWLVRLPNLFDSPTHASSSTHLENLTAFIHQILSTSSLLISPHARYKLDEFIDLSIATSYIEAKQVIPELDNRDDKKLYKELYQLIEKIYLGEDVETANKLFHKLSQSGGYADIVDIAISMKYKYSFYPHDRKKIELASIYQSIADLSFRLSAPTFSTLLNVIQSAVNQTNNFGDQQLADLARDEDLSISLRIIIENLNDFIEQYPALNKVTKQGFYQKRMLYLSLPLHEFSADKANLLQMAALVSANQFLLMDMFDKDCRMSNSDNLFLIDELSHMPKACFEMLDSTFVSGYINITMLASDLSIITKNGFAKWLDQINEIFLLGRINDDDVRILRDWIAENNDFSISNYKNVFIENKAMLQCLASGEGVVLLKKNDDKGFIFTRTGGYTNLESLTI